MASGYNLIVTAQRGNSRILAVVMGGTSRNARDAMATRLIEAGFDCGGEHVEGVTYTSQDDEALASISLDGLIAGAKEKGASEPVKFLEINVLGFIVPFDTRHASIEQYVADGKLEVAQIISPKTSGGDTYSEIYTAVSTALAQDTNKEIHGIWAASSGYLDGACLLYTSRCV